MGARTADEASEPRAGVGPGRPRLPAPADATPESGRAALRAVRAFHVGAAEDGLDRPGADELPALMHRFRVAGSIRSEYPVMLLPAGEAEAVAPVGEWLGRRVEALAETLGDVRLVRDNLPRLELAAWERVGDRSAPTPAGELIAGLADAVETGDAARERLAGDLSTIAASGPVGAVCVGLDELTAVRVAMHLAGRRAATRGEALRARAERLREALVRLLEADDRKRSGEAAERMAESLGGGDAGIDPGALARAIGRRRGPVAMDPDRRGRIERALVALERVGEPGPLAVVVHAGELDGLEEAPAGVEVVRADRPSAEAAVRFDALADRFAPVALALRVAELETEGAFDASVFGPMVETFGRESLSAEEVGELPAVIAVEPADRLAGADMPGVCAALLSGRPIVVLTPVAPGWGGAAGVEDDLATGYRFDPGRFGLGLREARVCQTSASRPGHLVAGLEGSLSSSRASLHVVALGRCADGSLPGVGPWLHAGAALEGRAHAFFAYDPEAGPSWADRMDVSGNEQAEADWPTHELDCFDGGGAPHTITLAFTFADFALLEPSLRGHFRVVPEACPSNDLTPVDQMPAVEAAGGDRRIPFVWSADEGGRMRRLVISRRLMEACRDRLSAWRTLRELAGVRNAHVERALEAERAALRAEAAERLAEQAERHAAELEGARREAAGEAMGRLAEMLLEVDLGAAAAAMRPTSAPLPGAPAREGEGVGETESAPSPEPAAADEEDEALTFDEPYIDSALCTSCNDCVNINPRLFVYNENKQAQIGDPDAGTFAELVAAAEKCPARCIHPGRPRNPDEPNLESLTERARRFN